MPGRSDRFTAAALGIDHKTVGTVRKQGAATGEILQLGKTTGADGKERSARPERRPGSQGSVSDVWEIAASSGKPVKRADLPDDMKLAFFIAGMIPGDTFVMVSRTINRHARTNRSAGR